VRAATRRALAVGAAVGTLLLGGCGADQPTAPTAHATANGVTVTVTLLHGSTGQRRIRATFSPRQAGFHLYSIDLPAHGVDGMGIPTRLSVRGDLTAVGRPTADRPVVLLRPTGLTTELPVYPNGPVTFTVPVRQTGTHEADVVVSYGACGTNRCLIPVTNEVIHLSLA
jgi:hypothetical protein